ncbi:hypothetical protein A9P82_11560 [Arachidicoccus ginsenosidimutans]|uniref:DUF4251 domain-containing protein n=1 Tax=Arachidicoccus sp. BS20 TaxID=1850526 RepID=UPI0007F117F3|nr:DUF4251 domain-containing protein [Arachidicoccus sp. BS20]ANI89867.1 hypothetical protein A9P82_11560 [Arachidicoccus sp. BS20]
MKKLLLATFTAFIIVSCSSVKNAADKVGQQAKLARLVQSQNFIFNARYVIPQRMNILNIIPNNVGQLQNLSPGYYLSVSPDSVKAYLPYFGRAYSAPYSTTDNGININTKDFKYSYKANRKGMYTISIDIHNDKYTQSFTLNVGSSNYASLQVQSINRDAISFYGSVEQKEDNIQ